MKTIYIEAGYKVMSQAKGIQLYPYTPIVVEHKFELLFPLVGHHLREAEIRVLFGLIDVSLRQQATEDFVKKLKSDTHIKRLIGGTKWAVTACSDIMEFPIFLEKDQVGTIENLLRFDPRRPHKFVEEIIERNRAVLNQLSKQHSAVVEGEVHESA
jgi:hypothetical protein